MPKPPVIFIFCLCLLPLVAVLFSFSPFLVAGILILLLLMRWFSIFKKIKPLKKDKQLILESISASHFVEKVRWCLDRLEIPYIEKAQAGILGVFFQARTVPRLFIPTGIVYSSIGNSADILRFLWGKYGCEKGPIAAFLEPSAEALEFEAMLDEYGVNLQVWFYSKCLGHRRFTRRIWGFYDRHVSAIQKLLVFLLRPVLGLMLKKAFRIHPKTTAKSITRIESTLRQVEDRLSDGRTYLMGGDDLTFIDICFASLSGIWAYPEGYANGRAVDALPPDFLIPPALKADIETWKAAYPLSFQFIGNLYQSHRGIQDEPEPGTPKTTSD